MRIAVTHDDGTTADITKQVAQVAELLVYDMHELSATDIKALAELAHACRYRYADTAAELAVEIRRQEDEERAERAAWYRKRAESVVAVLEACD